MKFILLLLSFTVTIFISKTTAQAFGANNIVVLRVGSGTAALSNVGAPVYLDEFTTNGILVRSVSINNTSAIGKLVLTGNSLNEGFMTRSANKNYLVFGGYDTLIGGSGMASSSTINKTIAFVDANAVVDLSTSVNLPTGAIRTVISDNGLRYWAAGGSKGTYFGNKGDTGKVLISNTITNNKCLELYGNQIYLSTGQGANIRIGKLGEGINTTGLQPYTGLQGIPTTGSPNQFIFSDLNPNITGYDVLYYTDNVSGTLNKYSLVGSSWSSNGSVTVPVGSPAGSGLKGLIGDTVAGNVVMFANSASAIYKFTDSSGYNGALLSTAFQIATAATNTNFTSLAYSPQNTLPVYDIYFTSSITRKQLDLTLIDNNEDESIDSYNIEYSSNGNNFKSIAKVTNTNKKTYSITLTESQSRTGMYRVKMNFKNGIYQYSKTQFINLNLNNISITNSYNSITINSPETIMGVMLYDANGNLVLQLHCLSNNVVIGKGNLATGLYILKTTNNQNKISINKIVL